MKGYILFKNGKCSYTELKKKLKYKNGSIKSILIECFHPVFGFFYVSKTLKEYKKLMKDFGKTILSYEFVDGQMCDEDDNSCIIKNKYWFNDISELFSKILEIVITENIFNDNFWIYGSFPQYLYKDLKIKSKRRKKTRKVDNLISESVFDSHKAIFIDKKKWSLGKLKKGNKDCFVHLYTGVYFRVDSKIFKFKNYELRNKLYYIESYGEEKDYYKVNDNLLKYKMNQTGLCLLLESYVSKYVIPQLEVSLMDTPIYRTKHPLKVNGEKYKLKKIITKYFKDIEEY